MLAVQIVGGLLIALGALLLLRRVVLPESDLQIPGVTVKAPASVLILILGVLVFLFPWSPWWPGEGTSQGPSPSPSIAASEPASFTPSPAPSPTPPAPAADFAGTWRNVDPNARGIVQIDVVGTSTGLTVRPWGSCSPTPCDWGIQSVVLPSGATAFDVRWEPGFATEDQHYQLNSDGTLAVRTFTHFTDNSGRADYTLDEQFAKQ